MRILEQSPERDAALIAMLPYVAEHGWSTRALRLGLAETGASDASAWLFNGPLDMVETYIDYADRRMQAADLSETRISKRVRALIACRLQQAAHERAAVRRAAGLLALPRNAGIAARSLARTVDAIWHAAGDRTADFSWYTKRATLAAVYGATLLHWLNQPPDATDDAATLDFLDRRLAAVGRIGQLRSRLGGARESITPSRHKTETPAAAATQPLPL